MKRPEQRYRLRKGEKVVGFMRKISGNSLFYSTTGQWWRGQKIDYDEVDEWTGFKDMNGRHIFEWDIIHYKIDPDDDYRDGVILWQKKQEEYGILDIQLKTFIPLVVENVKMFNEHQLQIFSYLFINPDLKDDIGIE